MADADAVRMVAVLTLVMVPALFGALVNGVQWGVQIGTFAGATWAAVFAARANGGEA